MKPAEKLRSALDGRREKAEYDRAMQEQAEAYYKRQWGDACAPWFEIDQ